jgi:hypothetical protein
MNEYVLEKLAIPILVSIIGGLAVLIAWKYNTARSEKKKLYLPLLNEFSKSLTQLIDLIEENYPFAISKNTSTTLFNTHNTSSEFINLPKKIKQNLIHLQELKTKYLKSLNLLLEKVAPLESYVKHRPHNNNLKQYYIINFILSDKPPSEDIVINFPMQGSGGFHSLFCDKTIAIRIYNEANQFDETKKYKQNRLYYIEYINKTLSQINKEQNV